MSWIRCTRCEDLVDTDAHPESFWNDIDHADIVQWEGAMCQSCIDQQDVCCCQTPAVRPDDISPPDPRSIKVSDCPIHGWDEDYRLEQLRDRHYDR
jgi:hypothetical protein